MEGLVGLSLLAIIALGVLWNHQNAAAATEGVEFASPHPPSAVVNTLHQTYCTGATAKARSMLSRVTVRPDGPMSFIYTTKIGDEGRIEVTGIDSGSLVRARTSQLYVGSHPNSHFRKGFLGMGAVITHRLARLLGITPMAARMKRFQSRLEDRILRQLDRSVGT